MNYFIGNNILQYEGVKNCTLDLLKSKLENITEGTLDIETSRKYPKGTYSEEVYKPGLDPYVTNICMIQIGTREDNFIIDVRQFDKQLIINCLKNFCENESILKIGHNLKFEGKFFLLHFGIRLINVWDTMIAEKVLYNGYNHSYSLEALLERYFGIKAKKSINLFTGFKKVTQEYESNSFLFGTTYDVEAIQAQVEIDTLNQKFIDKSTRLGFIEIGSKPFSLKQINYGFDDVIYPLKIYDIQVKGRKGWNPKIGFKSENKFTQVLAEAEINGVPFSIPKWVDAYKDAFKNYNRRRNQLNKYIEENIPRFASNIDLFTQFPKCNIKWTSSKQVIELFKHLGKCPREKSKSTGKLAYTVGAKELFNLLPPNYQANFYRSIDVEIIDFESLTLQYLLFKKAEQLYTTFGKDWLKYVHPITYKVHTNYNQYMISSRLSSSNPNLQQIPGLRAYRDCFTSECLINSDFSAQELRLAAEIHKIPKMIRFFKEGDEVFGEDLHSFNATQMFRVIYKDPNYLVPPKELKGGIKNKEFTKQHSKERDAAKTLAFLLNYGGSPFSLAKKLNITEEEAEKYIINYFKGLEGMEKSFEKKKKHALKHGWIQLDNYTKKRYYFPNFKEMNDCYKEVNSLYPEDYRNKSILEKDQIKKHLKKTTNYSALWKRYWSLRGKLERRCLNLCIQGAAATMTKLAGILLYNYRWENNVQDVFQIPIYCHDEVLAVILDVDNKNKYAKVIEELMAKSGTYLLKQVPMKATAVISKVWEH